MKISCNAILDLVAKFHFDKHNNYSVKSLKMDKWFHLLINIYCRRTRSSSQRNCTGRPPSIDTEGLRVNGYWRIDIVNLTMIYRSKNGRTQNTELMMLKLLSLDLTENCIKKLNLWFQHCPPQTDGDSFRWM